MLGKLLSRRRRSCAPPTPASGRVYAIGDIHGGLHLLTRLLRSIAEDARRHPNAKKKIVYLGDYVDRGSESRGVIDLLCGEPLPEHDAVYLKGNHEDLMLRYLDGLHHDASVIDRARRIAA